MTRYTHRRVIQFRRSATYPSNKREMLKDFDILSKILLTAGLAIPSLDDRKPKYRLCTKLFEITVNMLALFVMVANIFFWQRRYSSLTLHFSTSLTIFFALSVRFVLYLSRGKVPDMLRNLVCLYDDVTRQQPYKSLRRPVLVGCFTTFLLTAIASILDGYRIHMDRAKGEHVILFLVQFNDTDGTYQRGMCRLFLFLVPIKMYFAYGVSVMILIFCSSVYIVAKRTVYVFLDNIEEYNKESRRVALTNHVLSTYLGYYNRITQSIAEIDDVLSPCVLLLYGLMISGQFYTLTVLISKDTEPTSFTTGLHNLIVFLLTTAAFLVVTLTASKVTEASEDIRRSLQKLSERIAGGDNLLFSGGSIGDTYLILVSVLNGSHLSFTGWKMFNINRSLILTTMGVMISYGVIIVQIGRKYDALEKHPEL